MNRLTFRSFRARIARRLALWGAEPGLVGSPIEAFYPQQPTCQVPDLWFLLEKVFGQKVAGTYVEVGGFDGLFASNTWGLAQREWRGFIIEPVPEFAQRIKENYREFPGVQVLSHAIAAPGDAWVSLRVAGPLTTGSIAISNEYEHLPWAQDSLTDLELHVRAQTLDATLGEISVPKHFEVLVIDVEGMESSVFSGFSLEFWMPTMLIVELADTHPDLSRVSGDHIDIRSRIETCGYRILFKDRVNTVFVRGDHV